MVKKTHRKKKILILSNDGACRGAMVFACLKNRLEDSASPKGLMIESGGVMSHLRIPLDGKAASLLKRKGLELDGYRPVSLSEDLLRKADLILACSVENRNYLLNLFPDCRVPIRILGIAPVIDDREESYESCFQEIQRRLDDEIAKGLSHP